MEKLLDLRGWLAAQHHVRDQDPEFGHWAHTILAFARKLFRRGALSVEVEPPLRWRSERLPRGEAFGALREHHRLWLIEQARILAGINRTRSESDADRAGDFLDHLIWYWTADGCHPHSGAVRRDAVKHDYRHLWWSLDAKNAIDEARKRGTRISSVVEHEHAVPKRKLINIILSGQLDAGPALERFARAVLVTKDEHAKLNAHFKQDMPFGWDPLDPEADPFARYADPRVAIEPNSPLTTRPDHLTTHSSK